MRLCKFDSRFSFHVCCGVDWSHDEIDKTTQFRQKYLISFYFRSVRNSLYCVDVECFATIWGSWWMYFETLLAIGLLYFPEKLTSSKTNVWMGVWAILFCVSMINCFRWIMMLENYIVQYQGDEYLNVVSKTF